MFTGLVETIGTVSSYTEKDPAEGDGVSATITDCSEILTDVHLGDSICTNGVCLTVTAFDEARTEFKVGIAPETLRRTNLGTLSEGTRVNLERAVTSDVRMGGHVVQGHVDTVATIVSRVPDGNAVSFSFRLRDPQYINYIVEKGFVAVDGTSLTVTFVDYDKAEFGIMMVEYTQHKVVIAEKNVGDTVNIEVDLTGKLIERQVEVGIKGQMRGDSALERFIESVVERKLAEHSFTK